MSLLILVLIGGMTYQLYSKKVVTLAPELKEISGIEMDKAKNFWAINDGGNGAKLNQIQKMAL